MRTTKHLPEMKTSTYPSVRHLVAILSTAVLLLVGGSNSQAASATWTNTAGSTFQDSLAWNPNTVPGSADTGTFSTPGTYAVTLTAPAVVNQLDFTAPANTLETVSLNLNGNSLSILKPGSSNPVGLILGDAAGTDVVYLASSTGAGVGLFVTNAATLRVQIGRNGTGSLIVTNGFVQLGAYGLGNQMVVGGGPGTTTRGTLVLSGPTVTWSNNASLLIGNSSLSYNCSMAISNYAQMTVVGASISLGTVGSSTNSILLDSNGLLFVATNTTPTTPSATIGTSGGTNNTVTVQGGAIWNNGNRVFNIGTTGGVSNSLIVGTSGVVSNTSVVNIAAGNSLALSGGVLSVSVAVTNSAGYIKGFGTISGNTFVTNSGTVSPGFGTSVGTITLSNNLTLVAGSTTTLKLDSSQTGSNDSLNIVGTLAAAGTLNIITNGTAPLAAGDVYNIYTSGGASGSFTATNLPPLPPSVRWNNVTPGVLAIVPQEVVPGVSGLTNQLANIGDTVVISATVTGVPTPGVYWQFNNVNVTDGAQPDGSTNSGSATTTLTISNAQTNETGTFCLIATNIVGVSTNCMALTVSSGCSVAPSISAVSDQTVVQGNNGTFNAAVSGCPAPFVQWLENGATITGATGTPLVLTNVQFAQDGFVYTIVASNSVGTASTNMTLHVIICPSIQTQPQSLTVTNSQTASFTVVSTNGVPAPTYQWFFNNTSISGATNATYTIASTVASNEGTYKVQISNAACTITSSNATLLVNSTMSAAVTPTNAATGVCYDTPLYMTFNTAPFSTGTGKIQIFNATNSVTPVDTIDTSAGNVQGRIIGTESFNTFPVIITANTVAIYPHLDVLSSNQTYYVTVDRGIFTDANSAKFAGITGTNGWVFTTKPTGPANPNNLVVAADGSGDFCTVMGAVDSLPSGNTTYTLINIRNGTYTEIVDTKTKNHITFRGQSRSGTIVQYLNNFSLATGGSTHSRMSFKVFSNDIAVENLTLVNTTPQGGGQAEALMIDSPSAHFILNNAEVDSRQDTILANVNSSQGYFYNSLIQGNFDYIWGGGNLFITNCEFRTIPTASNYNLGASRTDNGPTPGGWLGPDGKYASNGFSFVNCKLTRSSMTVSNIAMSDANGAPDGVSSWIWCHIDTSGGNGYVAPASGVISNQILWEFGNSNLDNSASVNFGFLNPVTNGDTRLVCATDPNCWLYGWIPQLAPNILTNPVSMTVTAGTAASFSVAATGVPDPSYQWLLNGTNVINATANNATLVISNALTGDAGIYSVIVSNNAGTITSSGATLTVVGTGATASFTASPTYGTEPLGVTFTDPSSGSPNITLFWDFGDSSQATNSGGSSFVHTYAAGTYNVTLTASNAFGANSTLVSNNLITVLTAFQAWQSNYFGCTACPQAQPDADPLGKGMSNMNQFLAGLNPTNPASLFTVISTAPSGTDIVITWKTAGVRTNAVQATAGLPDGSYNTNGFADVSGPIVIGVTGDTTTNYTDVGGATNSPARYYRIRLVP